MNIRASVPGDWPAIAALYPAAFPDEDLLPLVHALWQDAAVVRSLVAVSGTALAGPPLTGHVLFTRCAVRGCAAKAALLGPLAVAPAWQRQGVGSALVRCGLTRLRGDGVVRVCVLGDPAYYRRFGFVPEAGITPPVPLPASWREAWQSLPLDAAAPPCHGPLEVPRPWLQPSLWSP
jgi:putative acetyltransferase